MLTIDSKTAVTSCEYYHKIHKFNLGLLNFNNLETVLIKNNFGEQIMKILR